MFAFAAAAVVCEPGAPLSGAKYMGKPERGKGVLQQLDSIHD
jgi:hypothetical protein